MARKPGTPNKRSSEFREILERIRFNIPEQAAKLYPDLSIAMKMKMLDFLAAYCYPKLFAKVIDEADEQPQPMANSTDELLMQMSDDELPGPGTS